ncbi:porin [Phorcysia thermohydrogeniphila]|uniref:Phosphate-selective porin O/P n=1 Tax=Phorcysia thermohydrogeniphila TaxID=936138 RepID=A0A4R1GAH4_9BACT|nr:porin [Phorcysia thermohydrogeniphila]TCK03455.1 phosphate-selective porin O/P [Phorcysia thermohydrogeniphila]
MRKLLTALSIAVLTVSTASSAEITNQEILQKLQELEAKLKKLEVENKRLRELLEEKGSTLIAARKKTKKLKVTGRVLFRFSQTADIDESGGKSIYGDPGNGFTVRKARVRFHGKLNDNVSYMIHLRADRGSQVELWDAYVKYSFDSIPLSIKMGQFKVPLSMSYLKSGTELWFPERPVAVNKIAPVWRDVGLEATWKVSRALKLSASVLNGEGWSSDKIYNSDKKYAYVFSADVTPVDNESLRWRVRVGYEVGTDAYSKLIYTKYDAVSVERRLLDVETRLDLRSFGLSLEGGFLYDNPQDAVDSSGSSVQLGDAKGYYLQADYALPSVKGLHLVGRYSWLDPNDDVDDKYDVDYTSLGFYYLINGWQAAIRSAYIFANERHGEEVDNDLFVTEFQLLF